MFSVTPCSGIAATVLCKSNASQFRRISWLFPAFRRNFAHREIAAINRRNFVTPIVSFRAKVRAIIRDARSFEANFQPIIRAARNFAAIFQANFRLSVNSPAFLGNVLLHSKFDLI